MKSMGNTDNCLNVSWNFILRAPFQALQGVEEGPGMFHEGIHVIFEDLSLALFVNSTYRFLDECAHPGVLFRFVRVLGIASLGPYA